MFALLGKPGSEEVKAELEKSLKLEKGSPKEIVGLSFFTYENIYLDFCNPFRDSRSSYGANGYMEFCFSRIKGTIRRQWIHGFLFFANQGYHTAPMDTWISVFRGSRVPYGANGYLDFCFSRIKGNVNLTQLGYDPCHKSVFFWRTYP